MPRRARLRRVTCWSVCLATPSLLQLAVARTVCRRTAELRPGVPGTRSTLLLNRKQLSALPQNPGDCPFEFDLPLVAFSKPRDDVREEGCGEGEGRGTSGQNFSEKRARARRAPVGRRNALQCRRTSSPRDFRFSSSFRDRL